MPSLSWLTVATTDESALCASPEMVVGSWYVFVVAIEMTRAAPEKMSTLTRRTTTAMPTTASTRVNPRRERRGGAVGAAVLATPDGSANPAAAGSAGAGPSAGGGGGIDRSGEGF